MKRISAILSAFLFGNAFFCGSAGTLPPAVVGGVEVGGMTYAEAERALRAHIEETPFFVRAPSGTYKIALSWRADIESALRHARAGQNVQISVRRIWTDAEETLLEICRENAKVPRDARVSFSAEGFVYTAEEEGRYCPYGEIVRGALAALERGETEYILPVRPYSPAVTEEVLRARTAEISSFTTEYAETNRPRSHNIELAAARIAGTTLAPGEEFSFNRTVGSRTAENGFEEANVISGGEFVPGVGGGVCQASTTLFNAALRAGLTVTESRPHSLSVSYVPPSLDAMVSEFSDLKFLNPYPFPVYLLAEAGGGRVTFRIFGAPDGRRYLPESVVLSRKAPPPAEIVEGEEDTVLRAAREGITSESYLSVYEGETLLSRCLIRRDTYACVRGKIAKRREPEEPQSGEEEIIFP